MNSIVRNRLAIFQALQASNEAAVLSHRRREMARLPTSVAVTVQGRRMQLDSRDSKDRSDCVTLLPNLKALGAQKDALFAKVRYADQSVAELARAFEVKDPD